MKSFLKFATHITFRDNNTFFSSRDVVMSYVVIFPLPTFLLEFQIVGQGIVRMQTDERIARVALQWLPVYLSPGRGSGMQIAATGFRLQCLRVVRKGRYVMHRADRAYIRGARI